MVYCTKCGTQNVEDAKFCAKCGASLEISREEGWERRVEDWGEEFGRRAEKWGEQFGKRAEEECFGLPHGGAIVVKSTLGEGSYFSFTVPVAE